MILMKTVKRIFSALAAAAVLLTLCCAAAGDSAPCAGIRAGDILCFGTPDELSGFTGRWRVLDPAHTNTGEEGMFLVSLDLIGIRQDVADPARAVISKMTGVPEQGIFLACTHIHTGPVMATALFPCNPEYNAWLFRQLGTIGCLAIQDLAPAELLGAEGEAKGIAFVRRFRMKDGSIKTNPGAQSYNVKEPIGTPDETLRLVRIVREGKDEIDIVNFQVHPDVIGGTKWSADYPGFTRRILEGDLPGVKVVYLNGAQGDTNHTDISLDSKSPDRKYFPKGKPDGYRRARYMGQVIAGGVLQVWMKALPIEGPDRVRFTVRDLDFPANMPDPSELPEARRIAALYEAGKLDELTDDGRTVAERKTEAYRKIRVSGYKDPMVHLHMSAVTAGGVAFAGFPGEPFTDMGRGVRAASPFAMTMACCLVNGSQGYLPMYTAFAEGGYEATNSNFSAGVAEQLVAGQAGILKELYQD